MRHFSLILACWFLAFVSWFPIGTWFMSKIESPWADKPVHQFILSTIIGAALISGILAFASIWIPINSTITLIVAITGIILFWKSSLKLGRTTFGVILRWSALHKLFAFAFVVIALLCSAHPPLNNDSGLYYIQFIKWINSYPVIPGLANLHDRLGFNSHWHLLSAAYNLQPFTSNSVNDLNGFLFLLIGIGAVDSFQRMLKNPTIFDAIWSIFPLPFFLLIRFLTSTAPDLPSTLLPILYFTLLLTNSKTKESHLIPAGLLIVFAITIKVVSIIHGIILIPLLYAHARNREFKPLLQLALVSSFIAMPWLIRNVIQTGYIVFPLESIDLFNFDWKVPNELASNARKMVDVHARFGNYNLNNYEKPISEWFSFWFNVQSRSVLAILLFVIGSSVLTIIIAVVKRINKTADYTTYPIFLGITVLVSLIFWWKSGPNPRFVYGATFFFFAYVLATVVIRIEPLKKMIRFIPFLALTPMVLLTQTVLNEVEPKKPTEFSLMKTAVRPIYYPKTTDKCWEYQLPCSNKDKPDLQFRGNGNEHGFVNIANTD